MTSPSELVELATRAGVTIGTCESLTAGLVAATVADVPGASKVLRGGLVTYASELKTTLAGVDADWVREHGVINAETAWQMADGARQALGVDVAVSCTGVAGPDEQDGQSVGTVFLGVSTSSGGRTVRLQLDGDRAAIRQATVREAIDLLGVAVRALHSTDGSVG